MGDETEELEDFDNQLTRIEKEIEFQLQKAESVDGEGRAKKLLFCEKRMEHAKHVLKSFELELRELSKQAQGTWVQRQNHHNQTLEDLGKLLASFKNKSERAELNLDEEEKTADDILDEAARVQNQTIDAVERGKTIVSNTIDVAENTMTTLVEDREKLEGAVKGLEEIEDNIKDARKEIRSILKKLVSDNVCRVFMILILLAIVALIIVAVVHKSEKKS